MLLSFRYVSREAPGKPAWKPRAAWELRLSCRQQHLEKPQHGDSVLWPVQDRAMYRKERHRCQGRLEGSHEGLTGVGGGSTWKQSSARALGASDLPGRDFWKLKGSSGERKSLRWVLLRLLLWVVGTRLYWASRISRTPSKCDSLIAGAHLRH